MVKLRRAARCFGRLITSPRAFRSARGIDEALAELQGAAGDQFDPGVVDALAAAVERHGAAVVDLARELTLPPHLQGPSAPPYHAARGRKLPHPNVPTPKR